MTRAERAKQFLPFDSMKGLKEALAEREEMHSREEKRELCEEETERLSERLSRLSPGARVRVRCYRDWREQTLEGRLAGIDREGGRIFIENISGAILFEDIYSIVPAVPNR